MFWSIIRRDFGLAVESCGYFHIMKRLLSPWCCLVLFVCKCPVGSNQELHFGTDNSVQTQNPQIVHVNSIQCFIFPFLHTSRSLDRIIVVGSALLALEILHVHADEHAIVPKAI